MNTICIIEMSQCSSSRADVPIGICLLDGQLPRRVDTAVLLDTAPRAGGQNTHSCIADGRGSQRTGSSNASVALQARRLRASERSGFGAPASIVQQQLVWQLRSSESAPLRSRGTRPQPRAEAVCLPRRQAVESVRFGTLPLARRCPALPLRSTTRGAQHIGHTAPDSHPRR